MRLPDLRLRVQPASEQIELGGRDFTLLNTGEQVLEECGRKMCRRILGMVHHRRGPARPWAATKSCIYSKSNNAKNSISI